MEGYNINTNMFNYGNYDPELYNLYQSPLNLDSLNSRSSSASSYQTSATPTSVDDLSEQSQPEQTLSPVSQNASNEETQVYETQWTQPFLNSHYHGYYSQNAAAIAPYIRGYTPHWAAMGNFMMENPWYRYNQACIPISLQQEYCTDSESTSPNNSSRFIISEGVLKHENADLCSTNLTGELKSEKLAPQSTEQFTSLRAEMLRSPPSRPSSSAIPSNVVMPQPKKENCNNIENKAHVNVAGRRKGKTVFTYEQRAILEKEFLEGNRYLARNKRILLAKQLNVDEKHLKVWFQNRRVKEKKQRKNEFLFSIQNSKVESSPQSNDI